MLDKLIEVLAAIAVAVTGLAVADMRAAGHDDNGVGSSLADEMAALEAAGFGLATADAARAAADGNDAEDLRVVDGRAHAAAVLAEVAANAPAEAQRGLTTAIAAVSGSGGSVPSAGQAPTDVPVGTTIPAEVPASVPVTVAPPVDAGGGAPVTPPGGRP